MSLKSKIFRMLPLGAAIGFVFIFFASFPHLAVAQGITTGGLTGIVEDQTGAVLANATIQAVNVATGAKSTQRSRPDGGFSLLDLQTGTYKVTVSVTGFSDLEIRDVVVSVGPRELGKLTLKPTSVQTTIEVTESNPLLSTAEAQVSASFDTEQLSSLPLANGFDAVTLLEPGVVQTHDNNFSNNSGATFAANGQRGRSNNFEIDGQSNNDNSVAGPQVFFGNQDAISSIQVITNEFSAQYGRNMGTVVNYLTKSGTNHIHGSAFEFYEGNWGEAFLQSQKNVLQGYCGSGQSASSGCLEPTLARFTENIFGGTLGAPIMKDKLWVFGSVFYNRTHQGAGTYTSASGNADFPTPSSLAALASAFPGSGAVASMVNSGPYSIKTGNPRAGGVTDTVAYSANGKTVNVDFAPVIRQVAGQNNDEELMGRIDWQPTSKDHVFARYIYQDDPFLGVFGDGSSTDLAAGHWYDVPGTTHSIGGDITHTFSPSWVNQVRYSFQQAKIAFQGGAQPGCTVNTPSNCNASISVSATLPTSGNGFLGYGYSASFPQGRTVKVTQVQDNASWNHGRHAISFGGEWSFQNSPNPFLPDFNGAFSASGGFSGFLNGSGTTAVGDGKYTIHFTEPDAAAYLQDDWKVMNNLTLNLGLRWEFFGQAVNLLHDETVKREADPSTAFWDTTLPLSARTFRSVPQNYKNFQPRTGFSYNPTEISSRLVIRGGFAINFDPEFYNMFLNSATAAPVVNLGTVSCSAASPCLPLGASTGAAVRALTLPSLPRGVNPNARSQTSVASNFHNPYTEGYTLGVQWGPNNNVVFEVRYVGNHTIGLFQSLNANPRMLPTAMAYPNVISPSLFCTDSTQIGYLRPDCTKTRVRERANTAFSNYNGLQLTATTHDYHHLTATIAYTYSRTIDNSSDVFSTFGGGNTLTFSQNPFDSNVGERGPSGNSIPHVASASFVYDFPSYKNQNGLLGKLLGGYQLNGVWTYDVGQPVTPYELDYGQLFGGSGPGAFPGLSNYCDGQFGAQFGSYVSTCRPVLSNKKASATSRGIYLSPATIDSGVYAQSDGVTPFGPGYYDLPSFFDYLFGATDSHGNPLLPTSVTPDSVKWLWNNSDIADLKGNPFPGVGRNTLHANGWDNINASIFKNTRIHERYNLQLQFSAYNVLNHRQLGTADPEIDDNTTFWDNRYNGGLNARQVQIGAKVTF